MNDFEMKNKQTQRAGEREREKEIGSTVENWTNININI